MSLAVRFGGALAWVALSLEPAAVCAADAIAGDYLTAPRKVCFFGMQRPDGRSYGADCSVGRDKLTIQAVPAGHAVSLVFVFHNGHMCEFNGEGTLQPRKPGARLTAVDPQVRDCPLTIDFKGRAIRLTQSEQCRSNFCGLRAGMDGTVLYRQAR